MQLYVHSLGSVRVLTPKCRGGGRRVLDLSTHTHQVNQRRSLLGTDGVPDILLLL